MPTCMGKRATLVVHGRSASGTPRADTIAIVNPVGATVRSGAGDDRICGGPGPDRLIGGAGADRLEGRSGDLVLGGPGLDSFRVRGRARLDARLGEFVNGRRKALAVRTRLKPSAIAVDGRDAVSVTGSPDGRQTVLLAAGVPVPGIGDALVLAASAQGEGVLGRVISVQLLSGGRHRVSVIPAPLDAAYSRFQVAIAGRLDELQEAGPASASSLDLGSLRPKFTCTTKRPNEPEPIAVEVDLSSLRVKSDFDASIVKPYIYFSLSGQPSLSVSAKFLAGRECRARPPGKVSIPIWGTPLAMTLEPFLKVSAGGAIKVGYRADSRLFFAFQRAKGKPDVDDRVFNVKATPTIEGSARLGVSLGLALKLMLAGRVGVGGELGPQLTAEADRTVGADGAVDCTRLRAALGVALTANADVFVTDWTFTIAQGTFAERVFFEHCSQAPGGDGSGGGAGGGGDGGSPGGSPGGGESPEGDIVSPARHVGAGRGFSCGLRGDGTPACWGVTGNGQSETPPEPLSQVSVGDSHACGLRQDGKAVCWGSDYSGESEALGGEFTQVSAGDFLSCGLRPGGSVECWGDGLGGGTAPPAGPYEEVSAGGGGACAIRTDDHEATCWGPGAAAPSGSLARLSVGEYHSCGLRPNGEAVCAGDGTSGDLNAPAGHFIDIAAGTYQSCGLRPDGSLVCWGVDYASFGNPLPSGSFTELDLGDSHGCALRAEGGIACWGEDEHGATVPPAVAFLDVDGGATGTCARRAAGAVCWGRGLEGETSVPSGFYTKISTGYYHACGLRPGGSIECWGDDRYGQTDVPPGTYSDVLASDGFSCGVASVGGLLSCWGDIHEGDPELKLVPPPPGSFTQVTGGRADGGWPYVCALGSDDHVVCWGAEGRLAAPSTTEFKTISGGSDHACGLTSSDEVVCWGASAPTPLTGTFEQVSAGSSYDCGLRPGGSIECWGSGGEAPPPGKYVDVSAGFSRSCAVRDDGAIVCWRLGRSEIPAG